MTTVEDRSSDVFDRIGYQDITSHTFRRTVATLMDEAGLSARAPLTSSGTPRCR